MVLGQVPECKKCAVSNTENHDSYAFSKFQHQWRTFSPPWPTSPGPGHQPLDGSILLKFLLDSRLELQSFDTLDDLLGFRAQKL